MKFNDVRVGDVFLYIGGNKMVVTYKDSSMFFSIWDDGVCGPTEEWDWEKDFVQAEFTLISRNKKVIVSVK